MGLTDKTKLPQILKKLDQYLQTQGYELAEPYEEIRIADGGMSRCVLCSREVISRVVIPGLVKLPDGAPTTGTVCLNIAECHKYRKQIAEQKASALVARAKELEGKLVLPKGN